MSREVPTSSVLVLCKFFPPPVLLASVPLFQSQQVRIVSTMQTRYSASLLKLKQGMAIISKPKSDCAFLNIAGIR